MAEKGGYKYILIAVHIHYECVGRINSYMLDPYYIQRFRIAETGCLSRIKDIKAEEFYSMIGSIDAASDFTYYTALYRCRPVLWQTRTAVKTGDTYTLVSYNGYTEEVSNEEFISLVKEGNSISNYSYDKDSGKAVKTRFSRGYKNDGEITCADEPDREACILSLQLTSRDLVTAEFAKIQLFDMESKELIKRYGLNGQTVSTKPKRLFTETIRGSIEMDGYVVYPVHASATYGLHYYGLETERKTIIMREGDSYYVAVKPKTAVEYSSVEKVHINDIIKNEMLCGGIYRPGVDITEKDGKLDVWVESLTALDRHIIEIESIDLTPTKHMEEVERLNMKSRMLYGTISYLIDCDGYIHSIRNLPACELTVKNGQSISFIEFIKMDNPIINRLELEAGAVIESSVIERASSIIVIKKLILHGIELYRSIRDIPEEYIDIKEIVVDNDIDADSIDSITDMLCTGRLDCVVIKGKPSEGIMKEYGEFIRKTDDGWRFSV